MKDSIEEKPFISKNHETKEKKHSEEKEGQHLFIIERILEEEIEGKIQKTLSNIDNESNQFNKKFREQYVNLKARLAILTKKMAELLDGSDSIDEFDANSKKILSNLLPVEWVAIIRGAVSEIINQRVLAEKTISRIKSGKISAQDALEAFCGKKIEKPEYIEADRYVNKLIFIVDPKTYKRVGLKASAGCYIPSGNVPGSLDKLPYILIRADEDQQKALKDFKEYFNDYIQEMRPDDSDQRYYEQEDGESDEEFAERIRYLNDQYRKKNEKGGFITAMIDSANEIYSDIPYENWYADFSEYEDLGTSEAPKNTIRDLDRALNHEVDHGTTYATYMIENKTLKTPTNESEFDGLLDAYYKEYLDYYVNEALAHRVENSIAHKTYDDPFGLGSDVMSEIPNNSDQYLRDLSAQLHNNRRINTNPSPIIIDRMLVNDYYFYPYNNRKQELSAIKKIIGKNTFQKWNVEEKWKTRIEERFRKAMPRVVHIIEELKSEEIPFFRIEPGETWFRDFRWRKENPEIFTRALEKAEKDYDRIKRKVMPKAD